MESVPAPVGGVQVKGRKKFREDAAASSASNVTTSNTVTTNGNGNGNNRFNPPSLKGSIRSPALRCKVDATDTTTTSAPTTANTNTCKENVPVPLPKQLNGFVAKEKPTTSLVSPRIKSTRSSTPKSTATKAAAAAADKLKEATKCVEKYHPAFIADATVRPSTAPSPYASSSTRRSTVTSSLRKSTTGIVIKKADRVSAYHKTEKERRKIRYLS
jgi:hypothetical protein